MSRRSDLIVTGLAPAIWGSTYLVTTMFLPAGYPLMLALLRALPAGLLLLCFVRELPPLAWLGRIALLGALNFSVFWWLLFISAYRLPGGVGATVGAVQPLIALGLARLFLGSPIRLPAILAALGGIAGVALLILNAKAALDPIGIAAGLAGALSMAAGTVLSRRWQPDVPAITFTAWQLTAGGLLLLPVAIWAEAPFPMPTATQALGFAYLGLIGAALTYFLWFRGLARLGPATVAPLGFLSPLTATALGWAVLGQSFTLQQMAGAALILFSVWAGQRYAAPAPKAP